MSEPYVGQIIMAGFNYAPKGFAGCNGQILSIQQNEVLFALLGTTYGGNGISTFALPNLQGRAPMHFGNNFGQSYPIGTQAGEVSHTLLQNELPAHTHFLKANAGTAASANSQTPGSGTVLGRTVGHPSRGADFPVTMYSSSATSLVATGAGSIATSGGNQPHENRQPFLGINFCIALTGIFPSRN
jgi:microcystin-dependent protein